MFFKPTRAKAFIKALRDKDDRTAFLIAYDITDCAELNKTAIKDDTVYNEETLANLIEADLALTRTSPVAVIDSEIIPRILGRVLCYMDRKADEPLKEDDGTDSSKPRDKQGRNKKAPG